MSKRLIESETVNGITIEWHAIQDKNDNPIMWTVTVRKGGRILKSNEFRHDSTAKRAMSVEITAARGGRY